MKIGATYSHLNGEEWLKVHQKKRLKEIVAIIKGIDAKKHKTKISKEKGMKGQRKFSPKSLNLAFKAGFQARGWESSTTSYWVTSDEELIRQTLHLPADEQKETILEAGKEAIRSYNQTDFVLDEIAVEVQFGKYSFIAYDLFVKHLAFYVAGQIKVGVEILPMKSLQREMSSGPGYYEGALYDVCRQGRGVPTVPLLLIGVEP